MHTFQFKFAHFSIVKDVVTGFTGTITGQATYPTGCNSILVTPSAKDNTLADGRWFDEQRLILVAEPSIEIVHVQRALLQQQSLFMASYAKVLEERILDLKETKAPGEDRQRPVEIFPTADPDGD
jgi:hypothetical protein